MKSIIQFSIVLTTLMALTSHAAVKTGESGEGKMVINYAQADVARSVGRERIEAEIKRAAQQICGNTRYTTHRNLKNHNASRTCYRNAVEEALEQLDQGRLIVIAE